MEVTLQLSQDKVHYCNTYKTVEGCFTKYIENALKMTNFFHRVGMGENML
jgi:hypothetical protein